jgi:hypothetical protein
MRSFVALILLALIGCAGPSHSGVTSSPTPFVYPPPASAPQVLDVTWPELMVVIRGGQVALAREARSLQVSVSTADGRTYRTTEPKFHAIHEAIQQQVPNLRHIDFETE